MPIIYIADTEFKAAVEERKAVVTAIDGHMRWVVKNEAGLEYIMRPESARKATMVEVTKDEMGELVKIRALRDEEIEKYGNKKS